MKRLDRFYFELTGRNAPQSLRSDVFVASRRMNSSWFETRKMRSSPTRADASYSSM